MANRVAMLDANGIIPERFLPDALRVLIGTMVEWPSSTIPSGYLLCDGSAVSRSAYADLFAVIGTGYGAGDGSTTFNLPNSLAGQMLTGYAQTAQAGTASTDIQYTGFTLTVPPGTWELQGMIMGQSNVLDSQTGCIYNVTTGSLVPGSRGGASLVGASPDAFENRSRTLVVTFTVTTQLRMYLSRTGSSTPSVPAAGATLANSQSAYLDAKRLPYTAAASIIKVTGTRPDVGANLTPHRLIGEMFAWGGYGTPPGTLVCDGSAVSRALYPDLFLVLGETHGAGDGSTTFNLPDMRGRTVVGQDLAQTEFDALGERAGSKTHSHPLGDSGYAQIALAATVAPNIFERRLPTGGSWTASHQGASSTTPTSSTSVQTTGTALMGSTETGDTILPPYIVMNWLIKAVWTAAEVPVNSVHTHRVLDLSGIARGTAAASGGADGDLYLKYS